VWASSEQSQVSPGTCLSVGMVCTKNDSHSWRLLKKSDWRGLLDMCTYLSVGSTCTYLELPATKVTTASSMAAAGMANPMVQLTLSCTYTRVVTARKDPKLMAK